MIKLLVVGRMSLLPNDTYVNSGRALWAAAGSGGGGGGNTLTSPATVTPGTNTNVTLYMNAVAQFADSTLNMSSASVGGQTSVNMVGEGCAFIANGSFSSLTIGNTMMSNVGDSVLQFGKLSGVGLYYASPNPVLMTMDVSPANTVTIGTAASGVVVSQTQTTITGNYKYLSSFPSPINSGSVNVITNPTQTGLYAIIMRSAEVSVQAQQSCLSAIGYYLSGAGWLSGNAYVILDADPTQFAQIFLNNNTLSFKYVSSVQAQIGSMSAEVIQIAGNLNI